MAALGFLGHFINGLGFSVPNAIPISVPLCSYDIRRWFSRGLTAVGFAQAAWQSQGLDSTLELLAPLRGFGLNERTGLHLLAIS